MPPKKLEETSVCFRVIGGERPHHLVCPMAGPLGLDPRKITEDVAKVTSDWKGQKVTVKMTVRNGQLHLQVLTTASSLIIQALKEPPRSYLGSNVTHHGNLTMGDVIEIARTLRPHSQAKSLTGTVKEVLGTAQSVGCTVEKSSPKAIIEKISNGIIVIAQE